MLTLHALAMGFVVGINFAISLRLTGFAPAIPLPPLRKFYPLHWAGVGVILFSGIALLIAYPAKALTNPVFYVKLVALTLALVISHKFQKLLGTMQSDKAIDAHIVRLAYLTFLLWIITITAGRFLAYTYNVLLASRYF